MKKIGIVIFTLLLAFSVGAISAFVPELSSLTGIGVTASVVLGFFLWDKENKKKDSGD